MRLDGVASPVELARLVGPEDNTRHFYLLGTPTKYRDLAMDAETLTVDCDPKVLCNTKARRFGGSVHRGGR